MRKIVRLTALLMALLDGNFGIAAPGEGATAQIKARLRLQEDAVRIEWNPEIPGRSYVVEESASLHPDQVEWSNGANLEGWPTAATGVTLSLEGEGLPRFFRVVSRDEEPVQRGRLLNHERVSRYTLAQMGVLFSELGLSPSLSPRYGVDVYRIAYETIDVSDYRTTATGLVAIPAGGAEPLPLISYQHGTIVKRSNAPSQLFEGEHFIPVVCASQGYVGLGSDYLGLGESLSFHPYLHARSEGTAVIDCLYAVRELATGMNLTLDGRLFLTGYSQGGHATLAAQRQLQEHHREDWTVTASAPMSGPYLLAETAYSIMDAGTYPEPAILGYLIHAYQHLYGIADDWGDMLRSPYDSQLPGLYDGTHDSIEINGLFPGELSLILEDSFRTSFLESPETHPFYVRLQENDVIDWVPESPLRLYHTAADAVVPLLNAERAYDAFVSLGAEDISVVDVNPQLGHGESGIPSFLHALVWFETF